MALDIQVAPHGTCEYCEGGEAHSTLTETAARLRHATPIAHQPAAVNKDGKALRPIPYKQLDLNASWESFNLKHELTDKGIQRFVDDYKSTLKSVA